MLCEAEALSQTQSIQLRLPAGMLRMTFRYG